jgi:hypothetical protein
MAFVNMSEQGGAFLSIQVRRTGARFAASRLMADRSRASSSTAAEMASGGNAGFNRPNAARNRETNTTSPFVSRSSNPASRGSPGTLVWGGGPATCQPSAALVFGVGVGHPILK